MTYVHPYQPTGWLRPVSGCRSTNTARRVTPAEPSVTASPSALRPNPLLAQIDSLERELEHKAETISTLVDRLTRAGLEVAEARRVQRNQAAALRAMVSGLRVVADGLDGGA